MQRTYNALVDNGIYVAAYYLNKKVKELTEEDLINNKEMFMNVILDKLQKEEGKKKEFKKENKIFFSSVSEIMYTHNSCYTGNLPKKGTLNRKNKILNQFTKLLTIPNGTEHCIYCGKDRVNTELIPTRALIPGLSSHSFFNYSNNLQIINVCHICVFLSLLACLNAGNGAYVLLPLSDDDNFMEQYTFNMQKRNFSTHLQSDILHWVGDKNFNGYIEFHYIKNTGQDEDYYVRTIPYEGINLLNEIYKNKLIDEFNKLNLYSVLFNINNDLYLKYLITKDNKPICSNELFNILNKGLENMTNEELTITKNIGEKLSDIVCEKDIANLKGINNISEFENFLIQMQDRYSNMKKEKLFSNIDDFEVMTNKFRWQSLKRRLLLYVIIKVA